MGLWAGIKSVKASNDTKGNRFPVGYIGDVKVVRCFEKKVRKTNGSAFIAELEIVTSNRADVIVGTVYSFYQQLGGLYPDLFLTAVKEFVSAVCGTDPRNTALVAAQIDPVIEDLMDRVTGSGNELAGGLVRLETSSGYKNAAGADRTGMRWSVAGEDETAASEVA